MASFKQYNLFENIFACQKDSQLEILWNILNAGWTF